MQGSSNVSNPGDTDGATCSTQNDLSYVNCNDVEPQQKLSLSFIMHKKDVAEPSVVDNLSMVILKVAFTLNTAEEK